MNVPTNMPHATQIPYIITAWNPTPCSCSEFRREMMTLSERSTGGSIP